MGIESARKTFCPRLRHLALKVAAGAVPVPPCPCSIGRPWLCTSGLHLKSRPNDVLSAVMLCLEKVSSVQNSGRITTCSFARWLVPKDSQNT